MTETKRLWILGATDPEMAAIETLLAGCGEQVAHAVGPNGDWVHPGIAYKADSISVPFGERKIVYFVECSAPDIERELESDGWDVVHIDHHRPGDPGYGRSPADFMAASSIGQVLAMLGREPTVEQRLVAAADYCLAAAYRGECSGVDPDTLMKWRAASRAAFQKRPVAEVLRDVEAARKILRKAIWLRGDDEDDEWGRLEYADFLGWRIPELPEAAVLEGIPLLADMKDRDGREKVFLQAAPPELVRQFLAGEIIAGLVDVYGDPAHGFAGGYLA